MPPPRRKGHTRPPDVTVRVGDAIHPFRMDEVTALDELALERATGLNVQQVVRRAQEPDPPLWLVAALVWLSRMQSGEQVAFVDVASEIDYGTEFNTVPGEESESAGDPVGEEPAAS